jgi:hypothetical protein
MILMGVCGDDPEQPVAVFNNETRIGHDDLEPRLGIVSESDATIQDEPVAGIPVDI